MLKKLIPPKMFQQLLKYKWLILVIVIFIVGFGVFSWRNALSNNNSLKYVIAEVKKDTINTSVSGTGQVAALQQIDLKLKASGDVVYIGVKNNQEVPAGTLILQLDSTDAQQAVKDAERSLENSKLDLQKAQQSSSNIQNIENQIKETGDKGLKEIAQTYTDLFTILNSVDDILFERDLSSDINTNNIQYYSDVVDTFYGEHFTSVPQDLANAYPEAKRLYEQGFLSYQKALHGANSEDIYKALQDAYKFTEKLANITKTARDVVDLFNTSSVLENWRPDNSVLINQHLTNLRNYYNTINTHLTALLDIINSLDSLNNNLSVQSININSLELTIQQKEDALAEAKRNLSDYYVYAPFSGIVANFDIKKGESLSNGTVIASILTKQKIAEITLNEVDITNVKIGQKADITFDVIEDLHIPGEVVDIDTLATVTQGVVNYGVKVVFDTQDERVKPGMSVSVSIVTNSKTNILVIPNSAIKEQNNKTYVEKVIFVGTTPKIIRDTITVPASKVQITMTSVQLGLVDDMYSEVLSGLKEGDKIVLQTIASNSKTTLQTRNSLFQMPGMGSTGGMGSPTRSFRP